MSTASTTHDVMAVHLGSVFVHCEQMNKGVIKGDHGGGLSGKGLDLPALCTMS